MLGMLVGVLRRVIGGGEGSTLCEPPLYIREKLPYKAYTRGLTSDMFRAFHVPPSRASRHPVKNWGYQYELSGASMNCRAPV